VCLHHRHPARAEKSAHLFRHTEIGDRAPRTYLLCMQPVQVEFGLGACALPSMGCWLQQPTQGEPGRPISSLSRANNVLKEPIRNGMS
jgi:hypothetical protein